MKHFVILFQRQFFSILGKIIYTEFMMNNDEISVELLIEKIRDYVKFSVSQKRFDHSVRTAEMCQRLCSIYGLDERIGYLAGISHDMCKKLSPDILLKLA